MNTVKFSAAPAKSTTLAACDYLSCEFSSRRQYFDDTPTEFISQPWKRLVINKEKHITRRGYTLCFLRQLQDSLRRRDTSFPRGWLMPVLWFSGAWTMAPIMTC
ncbi:hypothetical protein [Candidatus Pantoea floridensis]|uniref:hypothetical protein n=1 Tax=Candidatus Pantoea floridensis TaxID=1938870 RepID=UPI001596FF8B|nr:hypothetical protein [Pantoea floridensis]